MESAPGDNAVRIVEMTTRYLGYSINSVDGAAAGSLRPSERSSTVGNMLLNNTACYRGITHERKNNPCSKP